MLAYNHLLIALGGYTFYAHQASNDFELILGAMLAIMGGLLPDIDHPQSWIGHRFPRLSSMISKVLGHRTFLHSPLALACLLGLCLYLFQGSIFVFCGNAFCLGYLTHLLGDLCTHHGIPIFWPVKKRFRIPCSFRSGGVVEHGLALSFLVLATWNHWKWFT
jgi:inner membrane protein